MGSWSWDIATGRVEWDAHTSELFGMDGSAFAGTFEAWEARLHPDDREWVGREIAEAVEEHRPFRFDHRCVWPDGSVHWLEGVGEILLHERAHLLAVQVLGGAHQQTALDALQHVSAIVLGSFA